MFVNNGEKTPYMDDLTYFYVDQPIKVLKIYEQVHMAKIYFLETKKNVIIDIGAITKEPSEETSISIKWLERVKK